MESRSIKTSSHPIRTLVYEKLHIKDKERIVGEDNIDNLYRLLTDFLDQYLDIFKTCHIVLIERQLPHNYKATRVAQHTLTYFSLLLRDLTPSLPMIFEIDPKLKGRELGASSHLNERGIKAWAIDEAKSLLTKRKDYEGLEILDRHKRKADDLADTLCQIEAFFSYNGWPLTQEIISLSVKPVSKVLQLNVVSS